MPPAADLLDGKYPHPANVCCIVFFTVPPNGGPQQTANIEFAIEWLRSHLPPTWRIERQPLDRAAPDGDAEASIEIQAAASFSTLIVETHQRLAPRDVERHFGSLVRRLRASSPHLQLLVVAPWLSARTRELLEAERVNYIDATDNAFVQLENPALFLRTQGAAREPERSQRAPARIRGPRAWRLVRTLTDVAPPYGVSELARTTGLNPGYVSQLLKALDQDALIDRGPRSRVTSVDIAGLLNLWAERYDVFAANRAATLLAPRGAVHALSQLEKLSDAGRVAVTGSFAAVRLAPVAGPALLAVYCETPERVAVALDLMPTDQGANVALLTPLDSVAWERTTTRDGVSYAAPAQVAVDCLTGNGRMPAEGEAVLEWMLANEDVWRAPSLHEARRASA